MLLLLFNPQPAAPVEQPIPVVAGLALQSLVVAEVDSSVILAASLETQALTPPAPDVTLLILPDGFVLSPPITATLEAI